ncbi:small RNA degrading nuclease 3-like [Pecten maximus]|uniref:small RNA degrading nuclease 3-like n=1 Tax=Pecten maximus TaxID=6579 RepID=UPI001458332A|nr:small RNA degrading nuclease 3-like [Pecten maximus]
MAVRLHSKICNSRVISQLWSLQRNIRYIKFKEVIRCNPWYQTWQVNYFRTTMEEPSFMLAADSDVDEIDLQNVMIKIRRKMKRRFQKKCEDVIAVNETCVDDDVQIKPNSLLNCDNGNDLRVNSNDSPAEPSQTSGDIGPKQEKKKRKLSGRLERILNHHIENKKKKMLDDDKRKDADEKHSDVKPKDADEKYSDVKMNTNSSMSEITCQNNDGDEETRNEKSIPSPDQYLALDCEFVGVGFKGSISRLGRCSIVDFHGNVVYDMYSCPEEYITDYRTRYSGITAGHMTNGIPFEVVQKAVKDLLKDKILVGHGLHNDLNVLKIEHPGDMIRDTLSYQGLRKKAKEVGCEKLALKFLAWYLLKRRIQSNTHCSVEDATATMDVFKLVRQEWEESLMLPKCNSDNDAKTQKPKLEGSGKEKELSEYLDDKFWPEDHEMKNVSSDLVNTDLLESDKLEGNQDSSLPEKSEEELNPVLLLNNIALKMRWEKLDYRFELQQSGEFVCKVMISGKEYQSAPCSSKTKAKTEAAQSFFLHHQRSTSDDNMDVMKHFISTNEAKSKAGSLEAENFPEQFLHNYCIQRKWGKPVYKLTEMSKGKLFVCKIIIENQEFQGTAKPSTRMAKTSAARFCISELKRIGYIIP